MKQPEVTPALAHLEYLDGWRGLAIAALLIGHFVPVPGLPLGTVGVNLFFVLSGYLMGQLLFVKNTPIPMFYRRRISRIVPAHAFFLLVIIVIFLAMGTPVSWGESVAALFFVNNYYNGELGNPVMPFNHIWSLSVEEHSYILLSLIAVASRLKWIDAKWAVAAFAAGFSMTGFWYWMHFEGQVLNFEKWIHTEVSAYGIFASTFFLLALRKVKIPTLPAVAYPLLLGAAVMLHWWSVPNPVRTTLGVGIMALTINLLVGAPALVHRVLSIRPLRMLGLWSFSIYLWQQPFYLAAREEIIPVYVALLATVGCGISSYYFLERPVRAYLNAVWKGRTAAGTVAAT